MTDTPTPPPTPPMPNTNTALRQMRSAAQKLSREPMILVKYNSEPHEALNTVLSRALAPFRFEQVDVGFDRLRGATELRFEWRDDTSEAAAGGGTAAAPALLAWDAERPFRRLFAWYEGPPHEALNAALADALGAFGLFRIDGFWNFHHNHVELLFRCVGPLRPCDEPELENGSAGGS